MVPPRNGGRGYWPASSPEAGLRVVVVVAVGGDRPSACWREVDQHGACYQHVDRVGGVRHCEALQRPRQEAEEGCEEHASRATTAVATTLECGSGGWQWRWWQAAAVSGSGGNSRSSLAATRALLSSSRLSMARTMTITTSKTMLVKTMMAAVAAAAVSMGRWAAELAEGGGDGRRIFCLNFNRIFGGGLNCWQVTPLQSFPPASQLLVLSFRHIMSHGM